MGERKMAMRGSFFLYRRKIFYSIICCLYSVWGCAQSSFPFLESQQLLGSEGHDFPQKMVLSSDSSFIIGGFQPSSVEGDCTDAYITKIDSSANVVWTKTIPRVGCQELRGMAAVEDGGVIFVGVTNHPIEHSESSDEQFQSDGWVVRLDKNGTILWEKTFGGKEIDIANAIEVSDKECFVVGGSFSNDRDVLLNRGGSDIWGFRISKDGKIKFLKTIGGSGNEWAQAIATCSNGDYVIAGFTNSPEIDGDKPINRNGNALVVRIRKTGGTVWVRSFPSQYGGIFHTIKEDKEGRIVVAGSFNQTPENAQYWLVKLNKEGKVFFDKKIGSTHDEYFHTLMVCSDSAYLLGGYARSKGDVDAYTKGKEDFVLFKFSSEGQLIWRKTFGGPDYERCIDICEYAKGTYFAIGEKDNYFTGKQDGNKDIWVLKIRDLPCDSATIRPDIFVRTDGAGVVALNKPVRFRARYDYGEKFLWDFGDGTTSTEAEPLKTYRTPGNYRVKLTISIHETCKQTAQLPEPITVK